MRCGSALAGQLAYLFGNKKLHTKPLVTIPFSALLVGLMIFFTIPAVQAAVGKIDGTFEVSRLGAATYRIPIWTPPGPRGVQPNLAIAYDSQGSGASGVVGVDWALSGLSAIELCPRNIPQDDAIGWLDRYCLDGKRLRLTTAGASYGDQNTAYQTEIADFSLVTALSSGATRYFKRYDRDGLIYEYGSTSDARVIRGLPTATIPSRWMLNKVSDRFGNSYTISYSTVQSDTVGEVVPVTISWGATTPNASTYNYTLVFSYTQRLAPDVTSYSYKLGKVKNTNRLASITIKSGATVVRYYKLDYEKSPTTSYSRLTAITSCADTGMTDCLMPTTAGYFTVPKGVGSVVSTAVASVTKLISADDFNGDGRTDLLYTSGSVLYFSPGTTTGFAPPQNLGAAVAGAIYVGDMNGSGRSQFIVAQSGYWYHYSYSESGGALVGVKTNLPADSSKAVCAVADVNGDGLPDLITGTIKGVAECSGFTSINSSQGLYYVNFNKSTTSNGVSFDPSTLIATFSGNRAAAFLGAYDANGDGGSDVFVKYSYSICFKGLCSPRTETKGYAWNGSGFGYGFHSVFAESQVRKLNWNEDNCEDTVVPSGTASFTISVADCDGNDAFTLTGTGALVGTVDWNGDGRDDIMVRTSDNALGIYLSTGGGIDPLMIRAPVPFPTTTNVLGGDIDGDGLADIILYSNTAGQPVQYVMHNTVVNGIGHEKISTIIDGYGNSYSLSYATLSDPIHTPGNTAVYPERDTRGSLRVVKAVTFSDGRGGTFTHLYAYKGARDVVYIRNERRGDGTVTIKDTSRGFEGFESITVTDSRPNAPVVKTYYAQTFPLTGLVKQRDVFQQGGTTLISRTVNTPAAKTLDAASFNQRYFPYISNSVESSYEVGGSKNGQLVVERTSTFGYDDYGNLTTSTITVTDKDATAPQSPTNGWTWTTTVVNTISPDTSSTNWCLGLPSQSVTTRNSSFAGETSVTQTIRYTPDYSKCRMTQEIVQPGTAYQVTTDYTYDEANGGYGNLWQQKVTGNGMAVRTTTLGWGTRGQFPETITNPMGQTTTFGYDYNLGIRTSVKDPNNVVTSSLPDKFGRPSVETHPDGTYYKWTYSLCSANCGWEKSYYSVRREAYDSANILVDVDESLYDALDRLTQTSQKDLAGNKINVLTSYNELGQIARQSMPYAVGNTIYWNTYSYDARGRVLTQSRPIKASNSTLQSTSVLYQGATVTTTDAQTKTTTISRDPNGWMRQSKDHSGYYQTFGYDGAGNLLSVKDSLGNTLRSNTYAYGASAYPLTSNDADLGAWSYVPNALGEVINYTDAKGSTFTQLYDPLSRLTDRIVSGEPTVKWTWGAEAASYNIGKLKSVTANNGQTESYLYDSLGRLKQKDIAAEGTTYSYNYAYNSKGSLDTLQYPASTAGYRLQLKYDYSTNNGALQQVKNNADGTVYWQANTVNAFGQVQLETLGNGVKTAHNYDPVTGWLDNIQSGIGGGAGIQNESYLYDKVGNLIQRQNNAQGLTEDFVYDDLHRLDLSRLTSSGVTTTNLDMTYDTMGRIKSRTDIASNATWTYGDPKHLHGVTQAGSTAFTYGYDANGNVTSRNGYGITWNKNNYPTAINGAAESITLSYDGNDQRWKQVYVSGGITETTLYLGGLMEKVTTGSVTDYRHYIYTSGRTAAAIVSRSSTGTNATRYVLEDHQDSISKLMTDATLTGSESFSAYGLPRNATTWSGTVTSAYSNITRQGYTWQTALGNLGLNHMNGRVQDAVTGRFLSADPYVTEPMRTQNYDRYAYVYNNPLSLTDPSGFCPMGVCDTRELEEVTITGEKPRSAPPPTYRVQTVPQQPKSSYMPRPPRVGPDGREEVDVEGEKPDKCGGRQTSGPADRFSSLPDFYSISLPFFTAYTGFSVTIDRYKRIYVGPGVGVGKPAVGLSAGYLMADKGKGVLNNTRIPSAKELNDFLSGPGGVAGLGLGLGMNLGNSERQNRTSLNITTPSAGVSYSFSFDTGECPGE